ncbi:MAG: glycosyltransferase family 2 protein [Nitrospiraceae bacterium]|nr:glycosyltransferase family 2 protein [Nitrospiraceae bacterium]
MSSSESSKQASKRPLVSVVIPTYKRASLLKKAIASVLVQEMAGEMFEMEIIVVDDCSPDETPQVVASFPGVRYMRMEKNSGASGARNAGIKRAKGKYIALLDDDDEFLTHKLMVQVPILEAHTEIGVVYGQSVVTGSDVPLLLWPEAGPSGQVFEEFITRTDDFLHPPTWLVRRELFEAAGFFDESKAGMEHYDMALRIAALTPWKFLAGGPVARGRFSKKGLWYSTIADGTNEVQLPQIVEAALARLPLTEDTERIKRKARAAVCASIAGQRWFIGGGLNPTREYLLTSIERDPGLLNEPSVRTWIKRITTTLAGNAGEPIGAVKEFWRQIIRAIGGRSVGPRFRARALLGTMLTDAALYLRTGSPRRAWLVGIGAVLHDPQSWIRPWRIIRVFRDLKVVRDSPVPQTEGAVSSN